MHESETDAEPIHSHRRPDGRPIVVFCLILGFAGMATAWWSNQSGTSKIELEPPVEKISINSANWTAFSQLEGIGPKLAFRIVSDRDHNGPFSSIKDLLRVNGIGPMTLDRIRPRLTIGHDDFQSTTANDPQQLESR